MGQKVLPLQSTDTLQAQITIRYELQPTHNKTSVIIKSNSLWKTSSSSTHDTNLQKILRNKDWGFFPLTFIQPNRIPSFFQRQVSKTTKSIHGVTNVRTQAAYWSWSFPSFSPLSATRIYFLMCVHAPMCTFNSFYVCTSSPFFFCRKHYDFLSQ